MFFLVLIILLIPSFASAALSPAEFAQAMGNSNRYQAALTKTHNLLTSEIIVGQTYGHYQQGWFVSNGVEILQPLNMPAATARRALPTATRVSGSRVLVKSAAGLLGPVAAVVQIGLLANDLHSLACGSGGASGYPSLNTLCSRSSAIPAATPPETKPAVGAIIVVNGNHYQLTSEQYTGSSTAGYIGWVTNVGGNGPGTFGVKWGVSSSTVNGATMYTYNFTYYRYSVPSTVPQVASTPDQFASSLAPNNVVDAPYASDFDKATKTLSDSTLTAMQPDADQIKALTNTVQQDAAVDAAQAAVDSSQDNYDSNPTADALQALNEAKAALEAQKAALARDNVVAPPVPGSGNYDSGIELPEKKSILSLLQSFASGSPIVSMLNSFTMSASGSGFVHLGDAFGKSIDVDFTRYESVLAGCGGVLLILVHGFAVLVVVRGW